MKKPKDIKKITEKNNIILPSLSSHTPFMENSFGQKLVFNDEETFRLKTFIQRIPAAIAIFDTMLNYIITSDRWIEETNAPTKNLVGKNHYEVVPDVPPKWRKGHERCLQGEHVKCEEDRFIRQDGSIEWLRWEILPWYKFDGEIGGIVMFVEHITKRKALEKKMKETIQALNYSNAELEKFAYLCAHDLNEPLRTIGSYGQLLKEELKEGLSPQSEKYLSVITESIKQMEALINGVLAYSQFEAPSLNKGICSLDKIIQLVKIFLEKKIQDKKAFIYADSLPNIYGDILLLTRLFQNLISNALKFNEADIPIIYITVKEQKNLWIFTIEDNGIGISPKYHKKIFELFKKLHNKSKYEGMGIGLSICKKIVTAHGGKIWLKSSLSKGSEFSFSLPKIKL